MLLNRFRSAAALMLVLGCLLVFNACSGQSGQRAAQGGTMGAVAGAAGGMVSALIFGGNVGEAAARGAVWGGTTGAVGGAMVGAQEDHAKKKQQAAAAERLQSRLGEDAFEGLKALAKCRHGVAVEYAKSAQAKDNPGYALAGLWLEVLTLADRREEDQARGLFPKVVEKDSKVASDTQAEENMRKALQGLMKIRADYNLPITCK